MKKNLSKLNEFDLITMFESLCIKQGTKTDIDDVREYNKLFGEIREVVDELRIRPGDARHLLIPLLTHEDWHVRLKAGIYTYALAPQEARKVLQWLRETRLGHLALEAGFFLSGIDKGEFTPT